MIAHTLHETSRPNLPITTGFADVDHRNGLKCLGQVIATSTVICNKTAEKDTIPNRKKPYDCMEDLGFIAVAIPKSQLDLHPYI